MHDLYAQGMGYLTLRKGQKLINYLRSKYSETNEMIEIHIKGNDCNCGYTLLPQDGSIRQAIFYMSDTEFDKIIND